MKTLIFTALLFFGAMAQAQKMKIRIAEIEIHPQYQEIYLQYAKEVGELSVAREAGVVCLFPTQEQDNPLKFKVIEIYRDEKAYEEHLKTPHFQKYKTETLKMVKSLKITEMEALNPASMPEIFKKL